MSDFTFTGREFIKVLADFLCTVVLNYWYVDLSSGSMMLNGILDVKCILGGGSVSRRRVIECSLPTARLVQRN